MSEQRRLIHVSVDNRGCVRQETTSVDMRGQWAWETVPGLTPRAARVDDLDKVRRGSGPCYSVRVLDNPAAGLKLIAEKIAADTAVLTEMARAVARDLPDGRG